MSQQESCTRSPQTQNIKPPIINVNLRSQSDNFPQPSADGALSAEGRLTPKPHGSVENQKDEFSGVGNLHEKAESLWHQDRFRGAHSSSNGPSALEGPYSQTRGSSDFVHEPNELWGSFISNYVPTIHASQNLSNSYFLAKPEKDDNQSMPTSNSNSTPPAGPYISTWSSARTAHIHAPPGLSTSTKYSIARHFTPLRVDTTVSNSISDENGLASATTSSSHAGSGGVSRSSPTRMSSSSSKMSSPSSKTDCRSPVSSFDRHDLSSIGRSSAWHYQNSELKQAEANFGERSKISTKEPNLNASELASVSSNVQFSVGVRSKLSTILPALIEKIPLSEESTTIFIAEFGCLNSRSMQLLRPIIEEFVKKFPMQPSRQKSPSQDPTSDAVNVSGIATVDGAAALRAGKDFMVIHEDAPQADFRTFTYLLDTHPESYMNPGWQASHKPSLQNMIFSSFVSRPFGSRIVPQDTLHFGFSLMDLHWTHTPNAIDLSLATTAQAELTSFLMARAREFCRGGVLVMAFIARSEPDNLSVSRTTLSAQMDKLNINCSAPSTPKDTELSQVPPSSSGLRPPSKDIWSAMTEILVPCLQRLVSCGMLKSDVARQLLSIPLHPRTPSQTMRVLNDLDHLWELNWSCGAGQDTRLYSSDPEAVLMSEPQPLRLPQPAWIAYQSGGISHELYTEHVIQMFKNLYESHFRMVLRERGKLSKGATEFVLDSLWDVLGSRIDDPNSSPIAECELEVQLIALRRR